MKTFFIIFLLSSCVFGDVSIKEAWEMVVAKNSSIKSNTNDVMIAKAKKKSAESMYLPSVSLSGSYTHLSEPVNIDTSDAAIFMASLPIPLPFPSSLELSKQDIFLADLRMLWPLYTGGKIDAAQDIYASKLDESKARLEMKKDEEFLTLVKYYYGVVVAQSLYKTRQEAQKALTLHYNNAKKLKQEGQIANIELLNAKVKLDAAKIETTKAKHKYEISTSALYSLLRVKENPSSELFVSVVDKNQEEYKQETSKKYAALKILDAKKQQSKSLIDVKEAAYMPSVAAYGNYNLYKDNSAIMESLPKWFGGVVVKINLLERKDRDQEIAIAKLTNEKVSYLKEDALEKLSLLVEKTYKEMEASFEEYQALDSSIALAKENFRLRKLSFKEGLSTSVEVVDAQMFLEGAKTKRFNAAYNFVQKVAQLCVLSGQRDKFFEFVNSSQEIK